LRFPPYHESLYWEKRGFDRVLEVAEKSIFSKHLGG
jgi:hypothetical protein